MNKRWFRNFCAACVMMLFFAILLVTAGCGGGKGLKIDVQVDGTDKKVTLETDYQIENGLKITRNITTGEYEIALGSATTKDAEMGFMVEMMRMLMGMVSPSTGTIFSTTNSFEAGVAEGRRIQTQEFNQRADDR